MKVLVTGAAGFIGSSLAEALLHQGHQVLGVDCFTDFYPRQIKETNLEPLYRWPAFRFIEADLAQVEHQTLCSWLSEYPYVSHQAAQAGVRTSWGKQFEAYTISNIRATQRLLEAAKDVTVRRVVYASSSSVYGQAKTFPLREDGPALPVSPYGVTKLAAENLMRLYHANYEVPAVSLRYFTVYGPRQRPDMLFHRIIRSLLRDEVFTLYGDGEQSRHFTYIADVVQANIAALFTDGDHGEPAPFLGDVVNIGGGSRATVNDAISLVERLIGKRVQVVRAPVQKGDVERTEADLTRAAQWLRYQPGTAIEQGMQAEIEWIRGCLPVAEGNP